MSCSYHGVLCYVMVRLVLFLLCLRYDITSCYICVVSFHIYVMLGYVTPRYAMLRYVSSSYVVLGYVLSR